MPIRIKVGDQILDAPDGLSPQNLVLWVRSNMPLNEPTTFSEGFHKKLKDEPIAGGAVGFVEGVPSGMASGAKGLAMTPITILQGLFSAAEFHKDLATDPVGTLNRVAEKWKNKPGELSQGVSDFLTSMAHTASTDPEAFGRQVGDLTGNMEVGIAAARAIPLVPKSVARTVGTQMEAVGQYAKLPLRYAGVSQVVSGDVGRGVASLLAPQMLESTGGAIRRWGGQAVNPTIAAKLEDKFADAMSNRNVTAYDERAKDAAKATKDAANAARLARIDAAKADLKASEPSIRESVSAVDDEGARQSMSTTFRPEESAAAAGDPLGDAALKKAGFSDDTIAKLRAKGAIGVPSNGSAAGAVRTSPPAPTAPVVPAEPYIPPGMGDRAVAMGDKAVTDMRAAGMNVPQGGIRSTQDIDRLGTPTPAPAGSVRVPAASSGMDKVLSETNVPADLTVEGTEGINPPPPASNVSFLSRRGGALPDEWYTSRGLPKPGSAEYERVGNETTQLAGEQAAARHAETLPGVGRAAMAVPDEWLDAVARATKKSGSKSRSFLASGLSQNDVQQALSIYRADPTISPETVAEQLEMLRAGRHSNNFENARSSAFERYNIEREQE